MSCETAYIGEEDAELPDRFHVLPLFGRQHEASELCWCAPRLEHENPDTGAQVWLHVVFH